MKNYFISLLFFIVFSYLNTAGATDTEKDEVFVLRTLSDLRNPKLLQTQHLVTDTMVSETQAKQLRYLKENLRSLTLGRQFRFSFPGEETWHALFHAVAKLRYLESLDLSYR